MKGSRRRKKASEEERVEPKLVSAYDLLYVDSRRIALFLSQFDEAGHLTGIEQSESISESAERATGHDAGVNLGLLRGNLNARRQEDESRAEGARRTYDPQWANVFAFVDQLEERGLLQRNLRNTRMGQIVLISGSLSLYNATTLKSILSSPQVREQIISQQITNILQAHAAQQQQNPLLSMVPPPAPEVIRTNVGANLDVSSNLPTLLYGKSLVGSDLVWYSLDESGLVGSASDLMLKHAVNIPGEWRIIGIVDAMPDQFVSITGDAFFSATVKSLEEYFELFAQFARSMVGRPAIAYGITPLVVLRPIGG